ncbi:MAG: hypothetical protein EOO06_13210 [Chitinophagaceae bacterium]|nr:MAG: hypothetical protein EOO06_13210 [Chitinophagaceae bacterium]
MNTIQDIDKQFCEYVAKIEDAAKELTFTPVVEFKLSDEIPKHIWNSIVYPGVYLIEMKNDARFSSFNDWVADFTTKWEQEEFKRKFVPNLKKKRISHHAELNEWIPIYLGKSKCVGKRIEEHLYLDLNRNTFALKLWRRPDFLNDYFRISTIRVDVKSYDQILPIIENSLRNKINPIIGRQ